VTTSQSKYNTQHTKHRPSATELATELTPSSRVLQKLIVTQAV